MIPTPKTPSEPPLEAPEQPSLITTAAAPSQPVESSETTSGAAFKPGHCQECYCGPEMDSITKLNIITCKPIECDTNCSQVSLFTRHKENHSLLINKYHS